MFELAEPIVRMGPSPAVSQQQIAPGVLHDVYVLMPRLTRDIQSFDPKRFFSRGLHRIAEQLRDQPVYFSLRDALDYSRFLDKHHGILRAQVAGRAILGHCQQISLREGALTQHQIHSCYPAWERGQVVYLNPYYQPLV